MSQTILPDFLLHVVLFARSMLLMCQSTTFQFIIDHLTVFHNNDCLKYLELELDEVSDYVSYRTRSHLNTIPADGDVVTADNKVGIYRTKKIEAEKTK